MLREVLHCLAARGPGSVSAALRWLPGRRATNGQPYSCSALVAVPDTGAALARRRGGTGASGDSGSTHDVLWGCLECLLAPASAWAGRLSESAAWGHLDRTDLKPKARPGRTPPPGESQPQLPGLLGARRPAGSASPGRAAAARAPGLIYSGHELSRRAPHAVAATRTIKTTYYSPPRTSSPRRRRPPPLI